MADVVDQAAAIRQLEAAARAPVHAYLLIGPPGSGKRALARGFAAEVLSTPDATDADRERHVRLALGEQHPDLRIIEPEGMTFRKGEAERMVRHATLAPVEGDRKVVVALGCELMEDEAAGYLLKIIEEPPASTVFVLLATEVVPELVTIASRCVRIEVCPLAAAAIAERLMSEGVESERAVAAASASSGDMDRARTLATDDRLALRHRAWRDVPRHVDGTGARAAQIVAELQAMIGEALVPLQQRQADEAAAVEAQVAQFGLRGAGKRERRRATAVRSAGSAWRSCASGSPPWPPPPRRAGRRRAGPVVGPAGGRVGPHRRRRAGHDPLPRRDAVAAGSDRSAAARAGGGRRLGRCYPLPFTPE